MSERIVIVGGGSSTWGPRLMSDFMLTPSIADSTYVLYDLNKTNTERIAGFSRKLARELAIGPKIVAETQAEEALADADYVIITITTGGLNAVAQDVAIAADYSIYHTVGCTVGPAGWVSTLRNVPVFRNLAEQVNELAPKAVILNYTNPMAQLNKTLSLCTDRPAVGLCRGLYMSLGFLRRFLGVPEEEDLHAEYGGVNHFFWITQLSVGGQDGYELLRERMGGRRLPEIVAETNPEATDRWALADELLRVTGLFTYEDDHTCEFLPQFITSKEMMEKYRLRPISVEKRRQAMKRNEGLIEEMIAGEIPARYRQRSREAAADIINAFVTGKSFMDVGNLPNEGQIGNLPLGSVVETPVLATPTGFRAVVVGDLPEPAASWVDRVARVEDLTVEAALSGDLDLALTALKLDPVCSHLDFGQVEEMGMRLLRANKQYLPQFEGLL